VQHLPNGKLSVLETVYGHWGGGGRGSKEDDAYIDREVRAFLQG
jgi:hypothetical protein